MRLGWWNTQFLHHAPHRFTNSDDVIVRHLALDRRGIIRMPPEWRGRTGVRHRVLGFREQLVDVLKRRPHMPLVMLAKPVGFCLIAHFSYRYFPRHPQRLAPACASDTDVPTRASSRLSAGKI